MEENTVIESKEVFNIVRSIYIDLKKSSDEEILNYFCKFDKTSIISHIHDIKKVILFEEKQINKLSELGINTSIQNKNKSNISIQIFDNEKILEESPVKVRTNHTVQ